MYSPKIAEDLIPILYRMRKARKIPMTRLVDSILREALRNMEAADDSAKMPDSAASSLASEPAMDQKAA